MASMAQELASVYCEERKMAFFNVEKLVIDGIENHGPETKTFPHYDRIMDSG